MNLTDIPAEYNVVAVAFMKGGASQPSNLTTCPTPSSAAGGRAEQPGPRGADLLGGADAHIELKTGDEDKLKDEIIRLVEVYGFDGTDIDLEQAAIGAANNKTVLPAALKK